jgi:hypothetical protein
MVDGGGHNAGRPRFWRRHEADHAERVASVPQLVKTSCPGAADEPRDGRGPLDVVARQATFRVDGGGVARSPMAAVIATYVVAGAPSH